MVLRLGVISLIAVVALTGCGRQGALEPPKAVTAAPASSDPAAVTPAEKPAAPDKPFILDRLI